MSLRFGLSAIPRLSAFAPILIFAAAPLVVAAQQAQPVTPRIQVAHPAPRIMTLASPEVDEQAASAGHALNLESSQAQKLALPVHENFREFISLRPAESGDAHTLTLHFAAAASLTHLESTPDFPIVQGGTCFEGAWMAANSSCTLHVRFTPQGPGHRLGRLSISNSIDATPLSLGIGGYGSSPVVSFTPSVISTVPQTVSGGVGILSGASALAVDGGDTLYMADTGNKLVRFLDSTGNLEKLSYVFTITDPQGIAVDNLGTVYISQDNPATVISNSVYGGQTDYTSGSGSCAIGATCQFANGGLYLPGQIAIDPGGNVFLEDDYQADRLIYTGGSFDNYIPLSDGYSYNYPYPSAPRPIAVDASDAIYSYYGSTSCILQSLPYYDAAQGLYSGEIGVAGGRSCGFSGDGGQARGALISNRVAQMVFDLAGNFYFTDTNNQRVRRIDGLTGVITTVAGNGGVGNAGDGGPATSAQLSTPTGLALDSLGQIYIISSSSTTTAAQLVRKVGTLGYLNLPGQAVGSPSSAQTVTVANTGNSELDFTHTGFSSGNSSDFTVDPITTTCNFTVPLASGRSCKIGFIFNPSTTGNRSAVYSITSNTIAGVNNIQLNGTGYTTATLTPASISYASTTVGSSSTSQTATLTNTGKAVLTISSVLISGTNATSYSDTTTCGTTLAVGASCTVAITFKPAASGTLTASLTITDNALGGHQSVTLTGVGTAATGTAKAALSPTSLSFAATSVGSTATGQNITLLNSGTASLGITSITMAGSQGADFPFTSYCGTSVAASSSCKIVVSFKPAATGTRTATLTVATSVGTVTAGITGSGSAAVKAATKTQLMTLTNPAVMRGNLTLAVQVSQRAPLPPVGKVQLWEGSRKLTEAALSGGVTQFKVGYLRPGTHLLHAVYPGTADSSPSRSRIIRQVIAGPGWINLP